VVSNRSIWRASLTPVRHTFRESYRHISSEWRRVAARKDSCYNVRRTE